jgi:hypothetical protein
MDQRGVHGGGRVQLSGDGSMKGAIGEAVSGVRDEVMDRQG